MIRPIPASSVRSLRGGGRDNQPLERTEAASDEKEIRTAVEAVVRAFESGDARRCASIWTERLRRRVRAAR
jgi:hypothetical protein